MDCLYLINKLKDYTVRLESKWLLQIISLSAVLLLLWVNAIGPDISHHKVTDLTCDTTAEPTFRGNLFQPTGSREVVNCRGTFTISQPHSGDYGLLIPVFRDKVVITVNSQPFPTTQIEPWRTPGLLTKIPYYTALTRAVLVDDTNKVHVRVEALSGRRAMLGDLYIGPEDAVRSQFRWLWLSSVIVPTLLIGAELALAMMFFMIWNKRRKEHAFGWLAVFLILQAAQGSHIAPPITGNFNGVSYWTLITLFSAAAYVMFARALTGNIWLRRPWLLCVAPTALVAAALNSDTQTATQLLFPIGIAVLTSYLLTSAYIFYLGWRRGKIYAFLFFLATASFALLLIHDTLLQIGLINSSASLARPGIVVLVVAIILLSINSFSTAQAKLDSFAEAMKQRAVEIELRLQLSFQELHRQREKLLLAHERTRIMRDLHDGMGAEMVAILALAERNGQASSAIAQHARSALTDMRLIISSLEDYGGDLTMALGTWRERAEPLVKAANVSLGWKIDRLPLVDPFSQQQILNILRILQEATTNALKHANASEVTITASQNDNALIISIDDNGHGFERPATTGRGLDNMNHRAMQLKGQLTVNSSDRGTTVTLELPFCSSCEKRFETNIAR